MPLAPYNPGLGQTVRGSGRQVPSVDASFWAHLTVAPDAATATYVHAAITLPAAGTTVVTTGITNPDVPRNLSIVGNEADIVGNVVIVGTDLNNDALTETIALNGVTSVKGTKAFKTVTSITVPARQDADEAVSVGVSDKVGLHHKLPYDTGWKVFVDAVEESPTPPITASETVLASNVVDLDGLPDGSAIIDVYYVV